MARLLALMLVLLSWPVSAHDLGVARVFLVEQAKGGWAVEAKLPQNVEIESPIFPEHCRQTGQFSHPLPRKNRRDGWSFQCDSTFGDQDAIVFPWQREGVFAAAQWLDGRETGRFFKAAGNVISVPVNELGGQPRSAGEVVSHYTVLGVEHILTGWDHLAFVLTLCLIATRWRLVRLVTAFTVGHSLTLALAVLGWVHVPVPPIEACIALSIAFVAREALRPHSGLRHSVGLVFAFGLLHGLGFASALAESGIEPGETLLGLLTFNVGVELGQLLFVLAVLSTVALAKCMTSAVGRVRTATAFGLGSLGFFWTIERVAAFSF